jgi:hypothetical protein
LTHPERRVLQREDAFPVAARDGFPDGAVLAEHRVGVQAQLPRLTGIRGELPETVAGDQVGPGDHGAPVPQAGQPVSQDELRLAGQHPGFHVDPGPVQLGDAAFAARCRVDDRDYRAPDPGVDQGLAAWRRTALVVAGFQGDDGGRPGRERTCRGEGLRLGMRFAFALVVSLAHDPAGRAEQDAADRWVRARGAEPGHGQGNSAPHRSGLSERGHQAEPTGSARAS